MKKYIITLVLGIFAVSAFAQKYAVVDSEYILSKMPNYKEALGQLDKLSIQYQRDVDEKFSEVQSMAASYQSEKVLLTEDMRKSRESDIQQKQLDANELQRKYFGPNGTLFAKREELLKPFYDQLYNAVREYATSGSYMMIIDKANNPNVMFASPKLDKSDEVLQKLGYK